MQELLLLQVELWATYNNRSRFEKESRSKEKRRVGGLDMIPERVYHKAIKIWGTNRQLWAAIEELAELQQAIAKAMKTQSIHKMKHRIAEEIADTYIVIEQLLIMFKISKAYVDAIKKEKLKKLEETLKWGELLK